MRIIKLIMAGIILLSVGQLYSEVPLKINFQGRLEESSKPVDGIRDFVFKIYDAKSDGNLIWTGETSSVQVSNGIFSVILETGTPVNLSTATFAGPRYIEISVGSTVLSPRQEIVSAPYALVAQSLSADAKIGLNNIDGTAATLRANIFTGAQTYDSGASIAAAAGQPGISISTAIFIGSGANISTITATGFYGDGSGLTNLPPASGDNLGNHIATMIITADYGITSSTGINAGYYQVKGSTMVAILQGIDSIAYGVYAGTSNTGNYNTFIGNYAGQSNTTGGQNTANGYQALYSNTTGGQNTANGYQALYSNTTGGNNTANGYQALFSNTTGLNNTANGYWSLYSNTTGYENTANGFYALYFNTTGNQNTANGIQALFFNTTGKYNTANGAYALYKNTTGNNNTANGYLALGSNTTGVDNTANGYGALRSNTTGSGNTANGYGALHENIDGVGNTANGYQALSSNTTGGYNTANGYNALYYNKTGSHNTVSGYEAGRGAYGKSFSSSTILGAQAGYLLTTGSDNIFLGYRAGYNVKTGSGNIVIGYNQLSAAASNNTLNIGGLIYGTGMVSGGSGGNIGIGTASPGAKLEVAGQIKITGGEPGVGKVLTSDASGLATWETAGAGGDDLGSHIATMILTANEGIVSSTGSFTGYVNASSYLVDNSTMVKKLQGENSIAYGVYAGTSNTGNYNTFIGNYAGQSNTTGYENTANGYQALYSNTTGDGNIANGNRALYYNTTGQGNTANGFYALYSNTTGSENTANGYQALNSNTTGNQNTANGYHALYSNTTGKYNTANGYQALNSNTTGDGNIANGYHALYYNTTGQGNTANGFYALFSNETGSHNTVIGYQAGYGKYENSFSSSTILGAQAGYSLTTGSDNIFLGYKAGYNVTTGTGNIVIGYNQNPPSEASNNTLNIGGLIYGTDMVSGGSGGNVGIGTASPDEKFEIEWVENGTDVEIGRGTNDNTGLTFITLRSPNGTKYYITVNDTGNLSASTTKP